jgi:hypothetical protein
VGIFFWLGRRERGRERERRRHSRGFDLVEEVFKWLEGWNLDAVLAFTGQSLANEYTPRGHEKY